ncbi:NACHT domain-containing protein [Streptomyces sp. HU2014]|uniref:NACHT domain-containing protein n=1 Tax=Streptomyces sp. HU2014 TaxID=2939414 RepID=UPI00200C2DA8|nr:NACHT domain-containing protein [Streptomyces sp. HU2014]UQI45263.1 NACHT domain-containing protein [Streptomyces sp. HU2014]
MTGDEATGAGAGRLILGRELRALLHDSGLDRSQALAKANRLLPDGAAKLNPQRVSERFAGEPGSDFPQLWALVEALLIECGRLRPLGAARSEAAEVRKRDGLRASWHTLWLLARKDPPPRPDPRLSGYLRAAARYARDHPYPDLPDTPRPPPLPEGCVPRHVLPLPPRAAGSAGSAEAGAAGAPCPPAGEPGPATDVFTSGSPVAVLIGAPGSGKSTLLRVHLLDSADGPPDGRAKRNATVPVLVPAVALTGPAPLPQALATSVTALLGRHLPPGTTLTEDFFGRRPRPRATWLVLVDGLDEVADQEARAGLLGRLADQAAADGSPYRFVVATRPLPAGELDTPGSHTARFALRPFTPDDLRRYAHERFRVLGDPDRHTALFTALIADADLDHLARTPLMASMLCGLYAVEPGGPFPEGRTAVYTRFMDRIYRRNSRKSIADTQQRAVDALEKPFQHLPDRQDVGAAAERARCHLPELVRSLAHRVFFEDTPATLGALAAHPLARPPAQVPEPDWNRFLGDLLRPTGLLTVQDGELSFPHRTFLEYHAACHATRDRAASAAATRRLVKWGWSRPPATWPFCRCWSMPVGRALRSGSRADEEASARKRADMSYAGFVLDLAASAGADPWKELHRVARKGGAEGGTFIALQAALGTRIRPETAAAARETLVRAALGHRKIPGSARVLAAETLAGLGDERGLDAFRAMADDPGRLDTLDPWHMPLTELTHTEPPTQSELDEARRATRRDTVAQLDAVIRAAAPGAAARLHATRARTAFGRLVGEEAGGRPGR